MITATRYHDISCGHRVVGHESKCRFLHGHNYRITFTITAKELDGIGRVIDFGVIKSILCEWLEREWDHKFLVWVEDPMLPELSAFNDLGLKPVLFNPTAENMAIFLLETIGPQLLPDDVELVKVVVEETRKCSAEATI
jgi:6-pyruvoyltetrahydropterin/6-carboxytetrahydropterin synthase